MYRRLGFATHYLILACIAVQLVTGPLLAWAGGYPVSVLGLAEVASTSGAGGSLVPALREFHVTSARLLAVAVTLHLLGVAKHVIINRDQVLDSIMVARSRRR